MRESTNAILDLLTCTEANRQSRQARSELAEAYLQVSREKPPKNFVDLNQRGQQADKAGKPDQSLQKQICKFQGRNFQKTLGI